MLTAEQFRLLKLAEECSEVSKEALKYIQFGANHVYEGEQVQDRLRGEVLDVLVVIRLLQRQGVLDTILSEDVTEHYNRKAGKIISRTIEHVQCGAVSPDIFVHTPDRLT